MHGDLSEYNVLYLRGALQVIDVSQSVEHDHPQALESARVEASEPPPSDLGWRGVRTQPTRRDTFELRRHRMSLLKSSWISNAVMLRMHLSKGAKCSEVGSGYLIYR